MAIMVITFTVEAMVHILNYKRIDYGMVILVIANGSVELVPVLQEVFDKSSNGPRDLTIGQEDHRIVPDQSNVMDVVSAEP